MQTSQALSLFSCTVHAPACSQIPYGVHHTKMFLIGFEEDDQSFCRVVVHTANLVLSDIEYKTQGGYCQDFPLKQKKSGAGKGKRIEVVNPYKRKRDDTVGKSEENPFREEDVGVPFEEDLITYLESYRYLTRQTWGGVRSNRQMSWLQLIRSYDYSSAYAVLIPSTPGYHKQDSYHDFGYLKLRRAIIDWVCPGIESSKQSSPPNPLLCQFSSIGSLNAKWLDQFLSAIDASTTQSYDPIKHKAPTGKKEKDKQPPLSSRMKIIWPTAEEVRTCVEGYRGGFVSINTCFRFGN